MGRLPKPSAIRKLEGMRGHRPLNKREPRARPGEPDMPADLDKEARKEWSRLVPILLGAGVLTEMDSGVLANYCRAYSTRLRAELQMRRESGNGEPELALTMRTGRRYRNPLQAEIDRQTEIMNKLAAELGMTPSARSRVHTVSWPGGIDPLELALCSSD
jgi:P27 family predicted phage terminase small subunit